MASGHHTIVLAQFTPDQSSRTYMDFETVSMAMNGIIRLFEQRLKELNPRLRNITYDITDLYNYIDALGDISCLVFNPELNCYVPYGSEWIKQRIFTLLKKQAQ